MFKDYDKYLSISLKVYLFVLIIIFIMKMVGLDYFGLDVNNPIMLKINDFVTKYYLENVYYSITLYIHVYIFVSITNHDNSKKAKIYALPITILSVILKILEVKIANTILITIIDLIFLTTACMIYNKLKQPKKILISSLKLFVFNVLFQLISLYLRNIQYYNINLSFFIRAILDLDYILMLLIYQKYIFIKGGVTKCGVEVSLSSLKKINLKNLLKKLQRNWHKFKKQDKVTKLTFIIYFIFSLIWNVLSVILILLVARLNDTFVECIFILTSFWLSKGRFGKPFHFKSMSICFVVSNLTYYALNRITTPLGISIIVPILLGVGLSYVTSKFVKKVYKPLYRGIPEELFEETILKVVDKDSLKYKICYDFYIKKKSVVSLAMKYNYSEAGIRKIKDRINDKIKRLN